MKRSANQFDLEEARLSWGGKESVSVIIPAKASQSILDRCLAALLAQDLDPNGFEVIVVDHNSEVPLCAPELAADLNVRILRLETGDGPGAARSYGAAHASGSILVFLDVDVLPSPSMIREYASVPAHDPLAVGLGFRTFIDDSRVDPAELERATLAKDIDTFLASGPETEGQEWIDAFLEQTSQHMEWRDDLWVVVVGAGISVSTRMYRFSGGFRDFEEHGVEDTEFGYRLAQAGAKFVPNRHAHGYHMGLRTISRERDRINRRRVGILANEIAHTRYRPTLSGRMWSVPKIVCQVEVRPNDTFESIRDTIHDLLEQTLQDLAVIVWGSEPDDSELLSYWFGSDARVHFNFADACGIPQSSPFTVRLRAGTRFAKTSLERTKSELIERQVGLVSLVVNSDDVTVELWRTAALSRVAFSSDLEEADLRADIGEEWLAAAVVGVGYDTGAGDFSVIAGRYVKGSK